jgi:hypothetical protein
MEKEMLNIMEVDCFEILYHHLHRGVCLTAKNIIDDREYVIILNLGSSAQRVVIGYGLNDQSWISS